MYQDIRTNHAGETGAVAIYRRVSSHSRSNDLKMFAERHLGSEIKHLKGFEEIIESEGNRLRKSSLLFLWRIGGFSIAAVSMIAGRQWVFAAVAAVEEKVVRHYQVQLDSIEGVREYSALYDLIREYRDDEAVHRDEADSMCGKKSVFLKLWLFLVNAGSDVMLFLTRKI